MYPEQNQEPKVTDLEYLEQIATKPPSKMAFVNRKILIGIIGFVVVLVGLIIATLIINNRNASGTEILSAQLSSLDTVINYNSDNTVNSAEVNKVTAEASIITASAKIQLASVISLPSPSKEILAQENTDAIVKSLDTAKSTGNLSGEYILAMEIKLQAVISSLDQLYQQTNSAKQRQIIEQVKSDFTEVYNRLVAI